MNEILTSFISNESPFGKLMTRIGIVIAANILFVLFSFPVVTAGAAYVALYHVMLKTLRGDGVINPFKQFWVGFKNNFKQATIYWVIVLALVLFGYMDIRICKLMGGFGDTLSKAIITLGVILAVITIYMFPTMAAFADTIPHLLRNAFYFAIKKPFKLVVIAFFNIFPMVLTYSDPQTMPLYAFIWMFFGFGAIALLGAVLLLPEFKPFLPLVDACGDFILDPEDEALWADGPEGEAAREEAMKNAATGGHEKTEEEILEEMLKLGM